MLFRRMLYLSIIVMLLVLSVPFPHFVDAAALSPQPIKIVLDAGHGGHDSGAIGVNGIYEKDVNLDITLRLRDLLLLEGYDVVLTREVDRTLVPYKTNEQKRADLQARVDVATNVLADMFVSIHSNSFKANSQGTLILYYDPSNSSPQYAATERMNQWSQESKQLGTVVLNSIIGRLGLKNLGVEPSNVYVVRSGTVPSILVETAFLSNKEEASKLADPTFRQQMAEAIANGISSYMPPRYIDIRNHWAKAEIASLSYLGVINGYVGGLFKPDQEMTRIEWIAMLDRALAMTVAVEEESLERLNSPFPDISKTHWAYEALMRSVQRGIVTGFADGTLLLDEKIRREEMVVMLYRAIHYKNSLEQKVESVDLDTIDQGYEWSKDNDKGLESMEETVRVSAVSATDEHIPVISFHDIPAIHWSLEAIAALSATGMIKGIHADEFGLGKIVSRAEAATVLYRLLNQ